MGCNKVFFVWSDAHSSGRIKTGLFTYKKRFSVSSHTAHCDIMSSSGITGNVFNAIGGCAVIKSQTKLSTMHSWTE